MPHPISVVFIAFPKVQFERKLLPKPGDKAFFPSYDITMTQELKAEQRMLSMHLKIRSRRAKTAVVSFNFEVDAVFRCAEFDRSEQALQEFSQSTTPMMLLWPYVRPFVNTQMYHLGLPDYHLPLVLRWEKQEGNQVSIVKGERL